ncbi:MAG TPA: TIR domain-containing protein [Verrucomicrobiae bacterium]|nr:TIR domain-containing protein [Verrucomicrobiae bacterium]
MSPKVFISYSWTSPAHQSQVKEWAERLVSDGVDVVLDLWDLKEGQDKYAFMERMVTDPGVTHVLVVSDKAYSEKADARKAGVGTESQIISKEVYEKVDQTKFIPLVCEFADDNTPFLPTFLKSRIWMDFSSQESANSNWERLIRLLFGQPLHQKPTLGKPPVYLIEGAAVPTNPARAKFETLRQAILQAKPGVGLYRQAFLDTCYEFADSLRVRQRPSANDLGKMILEDCGKLTPVRDHIVDWVLLESTALPSQEFSEALIEALERLRELKSRPEEVTSWQEGWFEAHRLFVYETFLYVVAGLLKSRSYDNLHSIFATHYMLPESDRYGKERFSRFDCFLAFSEALHPVLDPPGQKLHSPAAELVKRQAQRPDLPFSEIVQADLLCLLMAFVFEGVRWYPQMLHYARRSKDFPFFIRAAQRRSFKNLAAITGIDSADELRSAVKAGHERLQVGNWHNFWHDRNFWEAMNMDNLDTVQ